MSIPPAAPESLPTGLLMQEYRETLLQLGGDLRAGRITGMGHSGTTDLQRRADALEAEVSRRVGW